MAGEYQSHTPSFVQEQAAGRAIQQRAHRRFMEINQARYIGRLTEDGDSGVLLMANDGDPRRARRMQLEVWGGNELLVLDDARGRTG